MHLTFPTDKELNELSLLSKSFDPESHIKPNAYLYAPEITIVYLHIVRSDMFKILNGSGRKDYDFYYENFPLPDDTRILATIDIYKYKRALVFSCWCSAISFIPTDFVHRNIKKPITICGSIAAKTQHELWGKLDDVFKYHVNTFPDVATAIKNI